MVLVRWDKFKVGNGLIWFLDGIGVRVGMVVVWNEG